MFILRCKCKPGIFVDEESSNQSEFERAKQFTSKKEAWQHFEKVTGLRASRQLHWQLVRVTWAIKWKTDENDERPYVTGTAFERGWGTKENVRRFKSPEAARAAIPTYARKGWDSERPKEGASIVRLMAVVR